MTDASYNERYPEHLGILRCLFKARIHFSRPVCTPLPTPKNQQPTSSSTPAVIVSAEFAQPLFDHIWLASLPFNLQPLVAPQGVIPVQTNGNLAAEARFRAQWTTHFRGPWTERNISSVDNWTTRKAPTPHHPTQLNTSYPRQNRTYL